MSAHAASGVALAPAVMGVLLEAQEISAQATELAREDTARKIGRLIAQLNGDPPPPAVDGAPLRVERLQVALRALA